MSRFPADIDLSFLRGAELIQVCLGLYQIQFRFHPTISLSVEGRWELLNASGERIDGWHEGTDRPPYQLHRLLGRSVIGSTTSEVGRIALTFVGGDVLHVFTNSDGYESFQIEPGGIVG